jgi:hypothetical protein
MNPISAIIGLGGTALSMFGGLQASGYAKQASQISNQIFATDQQINAQREQQMELEASRQQIQNIRNMQRARAMAQNTAVNQGAQYGSALPGAYGQISGEGETNALGMNQNLAIGKNVFALNSKIDAFKQQLSGVQGQEQSALGLAGIGRGIAQASGPLGRLSKFIPGMAALS